MKEYLVYPYRSSSKFCSQDCHAKSQKGKVNEALQEGRKKVRGINHPFYGKGLSEEHRRKISENHADMSGDKNPTWKGEDAKYGTKHDWVERQLGKPQRCDKCGTTHPQRYEWANRSRTYKRDIDDWIRLCVFCHRKADYYQLPL